MLATRRFDQGFLSLFLAIMAALTGPTAPAADSNAAPNRPGMDALIASAEREIAAHYSAAHPEVKEYILWTARTFGPTGYWRADDAMAKLPNESREQRVEHLAKLFQEAEYGRHLCAALVEASTLPDARLAPGLIRAAGYHLDDRDYDCRPKWMAVAALARLESDDAVPTLISLVDHGNQNTRMWARAALNRQTGQDFRQDKAAWARWWTGQGHPAIDAKYLQPWKAPPAPAK